MRMLAAILGLMALIPQDTIRVDVGLQQLVVTVRNESGEMAKGLRVEDFIVEEDGIRQTIAHFSDNPDAPIGLGILIDSTLSMGTMPGGTVSGLNAAKGITRVLLPLMAPKDEILLMSFSNKVAVRQ